MQTVVKYRLPVSCLDMTGTYSESVDSVLERTVADRLGVAELKVVGDPRRLRTLRLEPGFGRDAKASFKLTPDLRLTSADTTVTGVGGKIVSGIVGAATSIGAILLQFGALAADAGSPSAPTAEGDDLKIEAAYVEAKGELAASRTAVKAASAKLVTAHRIATTSYPDAGTPAKQKQALSVIARIEAAQVAIKADVEKAETLFQAWRSTTIKKSSQSISYTITVDELRWADPLLDDKNRLAFPPDSPNEPPSAKVRAAREKVQQAWNHLGCLVLIDGDPAEPNPSAGGSVPQRDDDMLAYRFPRSVTLRFYKRVGDDAVLQNTRAALVVDGLCPTETIEVSSGFFSENKSAITFSEDGIPTGFDFGRGSEAAGFATAVGGIPSSVASGLETGKKITDQIYGIRSAGLSAELARVKSSVELKQQQILLDGLNATPDAYAELERLKVEAETYEKHETLGHFDVPGDPVAKQIADLKQQVELLRVQAQLARLSE